MCCVGASRAGDRRTTQLSVRSAVDYGVVLRRLLTLHALGTAPACGLEVSLASRSRTGSRSTRTPPTCFVPISAPSSVVLLRMPPRLTRGARRIENPTAAPGTCRSRGSLVVQARSLYVGRVLRVVVQRDFCWILRPHREAPQEVRHELRAVLVAELAEDVELVDLAEAERGTPHVAFILPTAFGRQVNGGEVPSPTGPKHDRARARLHHLTGGKLDNVDSSGWMPRESHLGASGELREFEDRGRLGACPLKSLGECSRSSI
jgi:hypothetical protein